MSDKKTNDRQNLQQNKVTANHFMLGQWLVQPDINQLSTTENDVPHQTASIVPKLMDTLCYLAQHQGVVVSGQQLTKAIWPNAVVGENSLYNNIAQLRKYLGDTGRKKRYIETIPRKGYRLIAKVTPYQETLCQTIDTTATTQPAQPEQPAIDEILPAISNGKSIQKKPIPKKLMQKKLMLSIVFLTCTMLALLTYLPTDFHQTTEQPMPIAPVASVSTIAVYPFDDLAITNTNADPTPNQSDYFAQGLSENLIFRLSHIPGLRVISPTTASTIKQTAMPLDKLKTDYGIGSILKGSIQKSNQHIRVIVQLSDTANGGILWSTKFDDPLNDLFAIQDNIAQAIADALRLKLTATNKPQGITIAAFDHYLKGRFYWNKRHHQDTELAIEHFNQAIKISPNYAQAWAGLGDSYIFLNAYGDWPMKKAYVEAEKYLKKAVELNPELGEAWASFGQIRMNQGHYDEAEQHFLQAIETNPNYVTSRQWYGILLNNLGRSEEALKQHSMALLLDPLSAIVNRNMAFTQLLHGNTQSAREYFEHSLKLAPVFFGAEFLSLNFRPLTHQMAKKAILFIQQKPSAIPNTVPHKVTLSLLCTSIGSLACSQQYISQALNLLPSHPRIIDAKIALKAAMEQWHEVIYLLEQRRHTQPTNHQLQLDLAYAHYLNNNLDKVKSIILTADKSLQENIRFTLLRLLISDTHEEQAALANTLQINDDVSIVNAAVMSIKGENEQALAVLQKLLDLGWTEDASQQWWSLANDPALAALKQHPQFVTLVNRLEQDKNTLKELFEDYD